MTELDLPSALRTELRSGRYALQLSSEAVLAALDGRRRRRARTTRWLVAAAASGAAAVLIVAVFAVMSGDGPRSDQPAAPPTGPASSGDASGLQPTAGGHPVRGVPPHLPKAPDPAAAMSAEPPLAVRPASGEAIAFGPAATDGVRRVVVVADPEETVGLVGPVQQPSWAQASSLDGIMALVTDHEPSHTTYLMAFSPSGQRWFIAVTAADRNDRMEGMRAVATGTLPGT